MELRDSIVFSNGAYARYDDTRVGLLSHGLNYGLGCFEGIRGFWDAENRELFLLQLREHFERLTASTRILLMALPYSIDELCEIAVEVCVRNRFECDVYLRPLAYKSAEDIGVRLLGSEDSFALIAVPFSAYYPPGIGLRCGTSSWRRIDDTMAPARAKITGTYVNSALAKSEAKLNGLDEAILLSHDGHVSEGSAANLFLVRGGVLFTPDPSQNVLEGITRGTVIDLARRELGIEVRERPIDRSELYLADEAFLTGSAAGITYISEIDHRRVGDGARGPVTAALATHLTNLALGRDPAYADRVTRVYAGRAAALR